MKILLAIIQRIYFAWVALTFVLLMLLAFVFIMLSQLLPKRTGLLCTNFFLRCWAFTWGLVVGLRYRHFGRKPSYKNTTMVILTNHNSFLDTPASYVQIQGAFRTLAKKELLKTPIMGQIFKASGIMVDRSSPESRRESSQRMVETLQSGTSLVVYPEGTQNRTNEFMQPFFDGAFKAAIAAQVPILPIVTVNARQIMPQAKFLKMRPGVIRQYFLEPFPTKGLTENELPALRDKIRDLMIAKLKELDPTYPGRDRKKETAPLVDGAVSQGKIPKIE